MLIERGVLVFCGICACNMAGTTKPGHHNRISDCVLVGSSANFFLESYIHKNDS